MVTNLKHRLATQPFDVMQKVIYDYLKIHIRTRKDSSGSFLFEANDLENLNKETALELLLRLEATVEIIQR